MIPALTPNSARIALENHANGVGIHIAIGRRGVYVRVINNRYELREAHAGGMGVVWEAWDRLLNRVVGLKMAKTPATGPQLSEGILREARKMAQIETDENVVVIYDQESWIDESGTEVPYIVMEWVIGESLRERLESEVPTAAEVVSIGCSMLDGLGAAHEADVLHGDIKPSNVLVRRSDQIVKVCDFGAGLTLSVSERQAGGQVLGTTRYAAPEVRAGEPPTERSDLYSVAMVLYECSVGAPKFSGVAHRLAAGERTADVHLRSLNPSFPSGLADAIMQTLALAPDDRPSSADEFGEMLHGALQEFLTLSDEETGAMAGKQDVPATVRPESPKGDRGWLRTIKQVVIGEGDEIPSPSAPRVSLTDDLRRYYKQNRKVDRYSVDSSEPGHMYLPELLVIEVPQGMQGLYQWDIDVREADYRACKAIRNELDREFQGRLTAGVPALTVAVVQSASATQVRILEPTGVDLSTTPQFVIPRDFRSARALLKMTFKVAQAGQGVGLYPLSRRFTLGRSRRMDAVYRSPVDLWALDDCALEVQQVTEQGINCLARQHKGLLVWRRRTDGHFTKEHIPVGTAVLLHAGDEV